MDQNTRRYQLNPFFIHIQAIPNRSNSNYLAFKYPLKVIPSQEVPTQLIGFATADFHIVEHQGSTQKYPVPSNKYSCSRIDYAVSQNADIQGAIGGSQMFMRYASNFCGVQGLDFYKQSDGSYKLYI
ncbi:uncharacterized protein TRIVIDRAFT_71033 [Trichoderma virens Gv29-8]|uniref:Uncharacterized protein n=1 Tax=Hypocrea virens (strain Gv29-8 / FGSC 10586) TaxID=413071 RepID=G9MU09_HYPVG|nr:uncharacterized protein TRIVIDRAFT_71033 [Trichoderma virens Gv29-8]EHK22073.1 hypothetical protein TRIVIDRAFT_71033 [Trichoderma virens Gv29-8]UKZ48268.1 hypothetical protein TrVGV298_002491 [Trichoderma virens]